MDYAVWFITDGLRWIFYDGWYITDELRWVVYDGWFKTDGLHRMAYDGYNGWMVSDLGGIAGSSVGSLAAWCTPRAGGIKKSENVPICTVRTRSVRNIGISRATSATEIS